MKIIRRIMLTTLMASFFGPSFCKSAPIIEIDSFRVTPTQPTIPASYSSYSNSFTVADDANEYRMYYNGHHFGTIVDRDGTFAFRPRPGVDRNGFGSTLYLQPFLAKAALHGATIESIYSVATGIVVEASGSVSRAESSTYGTWVLDSMSFFYLPTQKTVIASGKYRITLDGQIPSEKEELNLYKLASNYLDDVPLLSGEIGDTGDMSVALYETDSGTNVWQPSLQAGHYPLDITDFLSVTAIGDFCVPDVPAIRQGDCPIQAAYKPTIQVDLTAQVSGYVLTPGFTYITNLSTRFNEDNIGITPVIRSSCTETQFVYDVFIRSTALSGDGHGMDADISATIYGGSMSNLAVYYLDKLDGGARNRIVGETTSMDGTNHHASIEIPLAPGAADDKGFLILQTPCGQ